MVAPWNSLPNWVKQSTTVNMFKNRLDEHLEQDVLQPLSDVNSNKLEDIPRSLNIRYNVIILTLRIIQQ